MDCKACEYLRKDAAEFSQNGVTTNVCNSLKNDTGLNPNNGHNNCTDMDIATQCFIGNMADELERYDTCDLKKFLRLFITNLFHIINATNCSLCGVWINIHNLWADIARIWAAINDIRDEIAAIKVQIADILRRLGIIDTTINNQQTQINNISQKLTVASYIGELTLTRTSKITGDGSSEQKPAFNSNYREGNMPSSVLSVASNYKGIEVHNTVDVPLMIDATFNCSIDTDQHFASCYIIVRRNGNDIGQTPFITPDTYDQQVMAKSFVLQPGQSASLTYAFRVGSANTWFQNQFGYKPDGSGDPKCCLESETAGSGDARVQGSYFSVKATSIVVQ